MKIEVHSPYQSVIECEDSGKVDGACVIRAIGPLSLLNRLQELRQAQGDNPKMWSLEAATNDDLLITEFILKLNQKPALVYKHEELCHCRMVAAEKVHSAIKQGCRNVKDIARTTLAGTGCGSCRSDIESIFEDLAIKN